MLTVLKIGTYSMAVPSEIAYTIAAEILAARPVKSNYDGTFTEELRSDLPELTIFPILEGDIRAAS